MNSSEIGVYGLGVMGRNLALNLESKKNTVSVFNRMEKGEENVTRLFMQKEGNGRNIIGASTIRSFTDSLKKPRKILMMVRAGQAVDEVIEAISPLLDSGDILIDGGNSHYMDTERRIKKLANNGIRFIGMGVSGGEEGARFGPSLMPGGDSSAWNDLRYIFESVAARSFEGKPCFSWIGGGGSGHFVKMVHNGIEYADMQLISEAYHLMKAGLGMSADEISGQFDKWSRSHLSSYLFEITSDILKVKESDGEPLIDKIVDSAGQKGTGKWTAITALENGMPLPGITAALFARYFSSMKPIRTEAEKRLFGPNQTIKENQKTFLDSLGKALLASRMICHAEGFYLITETGRQNNWDIDAASIAEVWQGGCIIRSELLKDIVAVFRDQPGTKHLMLSRRFAEIVTDLGSAWRFVSAEAIARGIPAPVITASLIQYDTLRHGKLPANLIQAQRDYFGAHTYERTDSTRGTFFHTDWQSLLQKKE